MTENTHLHPSASQSSLVETIVGQIQSIIEEAETETKPLELEPSRSRLFELFVMANGAGLTEEDEEPNLTSDTIAARLSDRWGLRSAAATSIEQQTKLDDQSLSRMRLLWSFLRMWMEWTYAWDRWAEFHQDDPVRSPE